MHPSFFPLQHTSDRLYRPWDRLDALWFVILELAALFLYTLHLNQPPLLPGTEQVFQQVAESHWRSQIAHGSGIGLLFASSNPTTTLLHRLIAGCYSLFGITDGITRLPGACFAASAIPLLYLVGRELFLQRPAALLSAGVFLTQWAVLQQGRLVSLTSLSLCSSFVVIYCLLRSRRDLRWALGFGVALGVQLVVDPIGAAAFSAIALLFCRWDTPRLLAAKHFWQGSGLGFLGVAIAIAIQQELNNIPFWNVQPWSNTFDSFNLYSPNWHPESIPSILMTFPWLPSLPWLLFWPISFRLLWHHYNFSWGKLSLIWGGIGLVLVLTDHLAAVQIYAILSLLCGTYLAQFWKGEEFSGLPILMTEPYPKGLLWISGLIALAAWGTLAYGIWYASDTNTAYYWANLSVAMTASVSSLLIAQNRSLWLMTLIWGTYCSLVLLLQTPYWLTAIAPTGT